MQSAQASNAGYPGLEISSIFLYFSRDENFGAKLKIGYGRSFSNSSQTFSYNRNILAFMNLCCGSTALQRKCRPIQNKKQPKV
jgi:hypothetical protein